MALGRLGGIMESDRRERQRLQERAAARRERAAREQQRAQQRAWERRLRTPQGRWEVAQEMYRERHGGGLVAIPFEDSSMEAQLAQQLHRPEDMVDAVDALYTLNNLYGDDAGYPDALLSTMGAVQRATRGQTSLSDIGEQVGRARGGDPLSGEAVVGGLFEDFLGVSEDRRMYPPVEPHLAPTRSDYPTLYDWVKGYRLMERLQVNPNNDSVAEAYGRLYHLVRSRDPQAALVIEHKAEEVARAGWPLSATPGSRMGLFAREVQNYLRDERSIGPGSLPNAWHRHLRQDLGWKKTGKSTTS